MDWHAVGMGLAELMLSFVLGVMTVWLAFRWFARITRELDEMRELRENNGAVGILLGSVVLSTALIVRQALYPSISTWQTTLHQGLSLSTGLMALGITCFSLLLSTALALIGIHTALRLFFRLTRDLDELVEISRNNTAVAVVLGCLVIAMGLFLSQGAQSLLSAVIPLPAWERIRVMGLP